MRELLRIITMNVADLLDEHLESDVLKGAFALEAVLGTNHGPRSPNTVFTLLHRVAGHAPARRGRGAAPRGVDTTTAALLAAAERAGVEIRTGQRVTRIRVEGARARGVELAGGGAVDAGLVVSNADPVTTLDGLVGGDHLDADFLREVRALRTAGPPARSTSRSSACPTCPCPRTAGPRAGCSRRRSTTSRPPSTTSSTARRCRRRRWRSPCPRSRTRAVPRRAST
ncbi:MAG: hypothetical protein U5K43_14655 [Halofilum sp. (in: g-proteobacteria)]|nr:hypothetical protein [Halofilum sp. (in: g-proteobacteria)]